MAETWRRKRKRKSKEKENFVLEASNAHDRELRLLFFPDARHIYLSNKRLASTDYLQRVSHGGFFLRISPFCLVSPSDPKLVLYNGIGPSAPEICKAPPIPPPTMLDYSMEHIIRAPPGTDLWRKPPTVDTDNLPALLINAPIDLQRFHTARVTLSGDWTVQYDQGGLVLFRPDEDITKYVKAGVELTSGAPQVGVVATSRYSDWSVVPGAVQGKVTIQVERDVDQKGQKTSGLWIYLIDPVTGDKLGIRDVGWWFGYDIEGPQVLLVGLYAARPQVPSGNGREAEDLKVKFEDFRVTFFDE